MGQSYITYTEMSNFFELYGLYPEPYEIEIIEMFDEIAMTHFQKEQEKEQQKSKSAKK